MALLAGPRRRQKYSVDPCGLNWSKDEDKFGHKMLEKMGWTKGKGLGANEDGNPDHITVKHKADTKGVGCTQKHADNWLAHQDDFNSLLSALSADHGPDSHEDSQEASVSVQSLEEKSQQQKSRVHYKKFTKGKDLSRYGSTDLDSILGKRKSVSAPVTPQVQSEANSDTEEQKEETASNPEEDKDDKSGSLFGVTTITKTTSIADYFAQKMAALKESRMKKNAADGERADVDIQTEDSNTSTVDGASVDNVDCSGEQPKKKKKSRKSKENVCIEMSGEDSVEIEKHSEVSKKSKKSKKSKQCQDEESVSTAIVSQDVETSESRQKGKKSKKNKQCKDAENLSTEIGGDDSTGVETRLESSKKCKESKKRKHEETECCNLSQTESATNNAVSSKKRKNKSSRKSDTKNSQVDIKESKPTDVELCDDQTSEVKKTKRSKKEKREKIVENSGGEKQEIAQTTTGDNGSSKKSKKKRKSCAKTCNDSADDGELPEAKVEPQSSKKKLRKTENVTASVASAESVSPGTKTDQVGPDVDSPKDEQQTTKQKLKRKKISKEKKEKRRKADLEKLEKTGQGLGFVGSNLDDISGYGGGFIVQYPWANKK